MRLTAWLCGVAALAVAAPAAAAIWDGAFAGALPPEDIAKAAVDAHPDVDRARAELDIARAQAREWEAGPHEFIVNLNNADNYPEFTWDVARAIRLPGKARLDRKAGALGISAAEDLVDDARHQTSVTMSDAWFDWVEAEAHLDLDRRTEEADARDVESIRRRLELQDASQLELEQAETALAVSKARRAMSEGRALTTRLALERTYPKLVMPARPPALPPPPPLEQTPQEWSEVTVRASHEIAIADFQAQQVQTLAERSKLDRIADPTIGIRSVPEFKPGGYKLTGVGVYISTPIGGARRRAAAEGQAARASVARVHLMKIQRESAALGEYNAINSNTTRQAWASSLAAVEAAEAAARRTMRGYDLGELDLATTLVAHRQAYDARRTEITARVDAWRAVTHLRLDAHDMWSDHHDEGGDDSHGDVTP